MCVCHVGLALPQYWPDLPERLELKSACMTVMMLCALTAAAVLRRRQVAVPRSVLQRATGSRLRDGRRREPLRPSLAAPVMMASKRVCVLMSICKQ